MSKVEELRSMVQDAIDKGATTVEEVHIKIAALPFELLKKIGPLESHVNEAKELHDNTIGSIYDQIRAINEKVGEFAAELLGKTQK